jgi:hypothetical protein
VTINLDSTTPYVDIPVTIVEPVEATITTTNGLSNSGTWIDSWVEVWQNTTRIAYDDDSAHSAINVLASIINIPLLAGEYFIRATSWNYVVSNGTQFPVGSFLLSTNLITPTPTPTPTETPSPTPTPTETPSPDPTPSLIPDPVQPDPNPQPIFEPEPVVIEEPEPVVIEEPQLEPVIEPAFEPTPIEEIIPVEEEINNAINELIVNEEQISDEQLQDITDLLLDNYEVDEAMPITELLDELNDEQVLELLEQLDENQVIEYREGVELEAGVAVVFEQLSNPAALLEELFSDPGQFAEALGQLGADMKEEEREDSQDVVIASVIATQAIGAAMAAIPPTSSTPTKGTSGPSGSGGSSGGGDAGGSGEGSDSKKKKLKVKRKPKLKNSKNIRRIK